MPPIRDVSWVLAQHPRAFTVELFTAQDEELAKEYVRLVGLANGTLFLSGDGDYKVIAGVFESRAAAESAISRLPESVRKYQPQPRQFSAVQADLPQVDPAADIAMAEQTDPVVQPPEPDAPLQQEASPQPESGPTDDEPVADEAQDELVSEAPLAAQAPDEMVSDEPPATETSDEPVSDEPPAAEIPDESVIEKPPAELASVEPSITEASGEPANDQTPASETSDESVSETTPTIETPDESVSEEPPADEQSSEPAVAKITTDQPMQASQTQISGDEAELIRSTVYAWAKAWSDQDLTGYLEFYAHDFQPAGGGHYQTWFLSRHNSIVNKKYIEVTIDQLDIAAAADSATVNFIQHYQSNVISDTGQKTLHMVKRDGQWKIQKELTK